MTMRWRGGGTYRSRCQKTDDERIINPSASLPIPSIRSFQATRRGGRVRTKRNVTEYPRKGKQNMRIFDKGLTCPDMSEIKFHGHFAVLRRIRAVCFFSLPWRNIKVSGRCPECRVIRALVDRRAITIAFSLRGCRSWDNLDKDTPTGKPVLDSVVGGGDMGEVELERESWIMPWQPSRRKISGRLASYRGVTKCYVILRSLSSQPLKHLERDELRSDVTPRSAYPVQPRRRTPSKPQTDPQVSYHFPHWTRHPNANAGR